VLLPDPTFYERALGRGEHLDIVHCLEPRSLMCVPLLARGRTIGAITLVSSKPDRRYDEDDLLLAEDLAYRCALAADNARCTGIAARSPAFCREACFRRTYPKSPASRSVPSTSPSERPARWEETSTLAVLVLRAMDGAAPAEIGKHA
jgi:GAF domain